MAPKGTLGGAFDPQGEFQPSQPKVSNEALRGQWTCCSLRQRPAMNRRTPLLSKAAFRTSAIGLVECPASRSTSSQS